MQKTGKKTIYVVEYGLYHKTTSWDQYRLYIYFYDIGGTVMLF